MNWEKLKEKLINSKYYYFHTDNGVLLCGDCIEIMKNLLERDIDLIITSHPYNIGIDYGVYKDNLNPGEYFNMLKQFAILMKKVLKFDGRFAINLPLDINMKHTGKIYRVSLIAEFYNILKEVGLGFHTIVILNEDTPHRVKYTAWGSWLSASSPYIYCPLEAIIIGYNKKWKKNKKGVSDITKEEFIELVSGVWKYRAETKKYTEANFSEDIPYKAMKILSYVNDIVLDPFMGCFDDKTEVLTTDGWKKFEELKGNELFYSLNPDSKNIELVKAVKKHKYFYEGKMYHIEGKNIDLLITPNHKIWVAEYYKKNDFQLIEISKWKYTNFWKSNQGIWKGIEYDNNDELFLYGFWLSNGFISKYEWGFYLKKEKEIKCIVKLLDKLNIKYRIYGEYNNYKKILINKSDYYPEWLQGDTKRIWKKLFNFSPENLRIFLKGYLMASGYRNILYSANKVLIDDLQRVLLLAGYSGIIIEREPQLIKNGTIKLNRQYELLIYRKGKLLKLSKKNIKEVYYKGYVYDITLEKNHILYVRRNGKPVWSGNSGTTAISCEKLNRKWIGIEINSDYCEVAKKRILNIIR